MNESTMDSIITYFNQQVDKMDIAQEYKMALLGMITAIGYENKKHGQKWETCFDCPLSHGCPKINGCTNDQAEQYASEIPDDCPITAEPTVKGQICQWIPCKERHPKERGKYLVSFTEGNQLHVSICDWQVTTRHWNLNGCRSYWHPVAWMPLPEPYREGGETE